MSDRPFVIPIAEADALAWAVGSVGDLHILLSAPLVPQAVFFGDLPNLASYRLAVRQCLHWRRAGAYGMVCRTSNQVVIDRLTRFGARATSQDLDGRHRYLMPKVAFDAWLSRF